MIPVLFAIGPIKIYTMGLFAVLGLMWFFFLLWRSIRLTSYREEDVFDMVTIGMIGSLIFARLIYVVLKFDFFGFNLLKIILINGYPGLSLWGGIFGLFITALWVAKIKKIQHKEIFDHIMSSFFVLGVFLSIGGFLSGSIVGSKTNFFLSIVYAGWKGNRHILGLYSGLLLLIGAITSYKLLFYLRKVEGKSGTVFLYGLCFIGLVNIFLDKLKEHILYLFGLRFDTLIALIVFLIFGIYLFYIFRVFIIKNLISYEKQISSKANQIFKRKITSKKSS